MYIRYHLQFDGWNLDWKCFMFWSGILPASDLCVSRVSLGLGYSTVGGGKGGKSLPNKVASIFSKLSSIVLKDVMKGASNKQAAWGRTKLCENTQLAMQERSLAIEKVPVAESSSILESQTAHRTSLKLKNHSLLPVFLDRFQWKQLWKLSVACAQLSKVAIHCTYVLCHRKGTAHDACLYILILFLTRGAQAIPAPFGSRQIMKRLKVFVSYFAVMYSQWSMISSAQKQKDAQVEGDFVWYFCTHIFNKRWSQWWNTATKTLVWELPYLLESSF